MYIIDPDRDFRYATIKGNEVQHDILMKCPDITKEEFEAVLKTKNSSNAFVEMTYWVNQGK